MTALQLAYETSPPLVREFIVPLLRGDPITVSGPLRQSELQQLMNSVTVADSSLANLALEVQYQAGQLIPELPLITIDKSDIELLAAAYQVCWFFHWAPEEERIWKRRQRNVLEDTDELLQSIGPPTTTASAIVRHILLRHLPRLYRTDHHLEFSYVWGDLHFRGKEPEWVRMPFRRNPVIDKEVIWVHKAVQLKPCAELYTEVLRRSPITAIIEAHRHYPRYDFRGALGVLAVPNLCRFVTSRLLANGLHASMPSLGRAFTAALADADVTKAQRRYLGRFLYNLFVTWVRFAPETELDATVDFAVLTGLVEPHRSLVKKPNQTMEERAREARHDGLVFYAAVRALHKLRGPLGAHHLLAEDDLGKRVQTVVSKVEPRLEAVAAQVEEAVRNGLAFKR